MDSGYAFNEAIKDVLLKHLSVSGEWFGDSNNHFGILIDLNWDHCPFSSTVINFINE